MESIDFDMIADDLIPDERGRKHLKVIIQITPDIFSRFLVAKSARSGCLSCGSERLFVPHTIIHSSDPDSDEYDEKNDPIFVTPQHPVNTLFRIATARYEICCQNCGFVALHQAQPVIEWAMQHEGVVDEFS